MKGKMNQVLQGSKLSQDKMQNWNESIIDEHLFLEMNSEEERLKLRGVFLVCFD